MKTWNVTVSGRGSAYITFEIHAEFETEAYVLLGSMFDLSKVYVEMSEKE